MNKSIVLVNMVSRIPPQQIRLLIPFIREPDFLLTVPPQELISLGIETEYCEKIIAARASDEFAEEIENIQKSGIRIIDLFSDEYPQLLREINSAPLLLYVKGDHTILKKVCFAIVGTRLATVYGRRMAERFSYMLANLGIVVVSGLARGIDTAAHHAALRGGQTIAVLGCGLATCYPRENKKLMDEIQEKGLVVSEFPLSQPPFKDNFPRRNRIISGLSKGVLVVEAALRSGALITARWALEQNREVFSLPGNIDSPMSKGPHALIKQGAKLVESLEDILGELNITWEKEEGGPLQFSPEEEIIVSLLKNNGLFLEEIIVRSGLERSKVDMVLLKLQLKGLIEEKLPAFFSLKSFIEP